MHTKRLAVKCLSLLVLLFLFVWIHVTFVVVLKPHNSHDLSTSVYNIKRLFSGAIDKSPTEPTLAVISTTVNATHEALELKYYRVRPTKVNRYLYSFILNGSAICNKFTDVVIIVHSLHTYGERRKAIRETWGGGAWPKRSFPEAVKLAFIFGTHAEGRWNDEIARENLIHGDIIQGNFHEDYKNMTLKSLLGLKWVSQFCPGVKYLIKTDDDMFINLPHLFQLLRNTTPAWSILGPFNPKSQVYRRGKWAIRRDEYPFESYPPYESGSAYVITGDLVPELLRVSEYVPSIFIDDVYITGILGKILRVNHIWEKGFAFWINKAPTACDIQENRIFTGTKATPDLMRSIWVNLKRDLHCKDNPKEDYVLP